MAQQTKPSAIEKPKKLESKGAIISPRLTLEGSKKRKEKHKRGKGSKQISL